MRLLLALPALALLTGCITPGAAPDSALDAAALPAATMPVEQPFEFSGSFGPGLVACSPFGCNGVSQGTKYKELDVDGVLTAADFTLTWSATNPAMQRLRLGLSWGEGDAMEFEYIDGVSPLKLELEDLEIDGSDDPYIWVWVPSPLPIGLVYAHTPQSFSIEGTLAVAPKA